MATITVNASALRTVYHQSSVSWRDPGQAMQGAYNKTGSRVGVMTFDDIGTSLKDATITQIIIEPTIFNSGSNKTNRVLTFWSSNYQTIDTSKSGASYPKAQLGTLTGNGNGTTDTGTDSTYPGKQKWLLNASTNSGLFNALAAYFKAGGTCLLLYNGETDNAVGYTFSANYMGLSACSITVEYTAYVPTDPTYIVRVNYRRELPAGGTESIGTIEYPVLQNTYFTVPLVSPGTTEHTTEGVYSNGWSWDWSRKLISNAKINTPFLVSEAMRLETYFPLIPDAYCNNSGTLKAVRAYVNISGDAVKADIYVNDNGEAVKT